MSKYEELSNCPFCGCMAQRYRLLEVAVTHKILFKAEVGCSSCNAIMIGLGSTPEEAWDNAERMWNHRANS